MQCTQYTAKVYRAMCLNAEKCKMHFTNFELHSDRTHNWNTKAREKKTQKYAQKMESNQSINFDARSSISRIECHSPIDRFVAASIDHFCDLFAKFS